jgi:hypothetical protein
MNVRFIASMSVVAADPPQSRKLFMDTLGLPLEKYEADECYSSDHIPGSKHFDSWDGGSAAGELGGQAEVADCSRAARMRGMSTLPLGPRVTSGTATTWRGAL